MKKPTASELEILQLLWAKSPLTVKEINESLNIIKPTGYTTTLKIMQIMTGKKILKREVSGKKHLYWPVLEEENTQIALVDRLLEKAFNGSAKKLVMQVLGNHKSSQEEIEEIRALLNQIEKEES